MKQLEQNRSIQHVLQSIKHTFTQIYILLYLSPHHVRNFSNHSDGDSFIVWIICRSSCLRRSGIFSYWVVIYAMIGANIALGTDHISFNEDFVSCSRLCWSSLVNIDSLGFTFDLETDFVRVDHDFCLLLWGVWESLEDMGNQIDCKVSVHLYPSITYIYPRQTVHRLVLAINYSNPK